jgi:iron complex outermembrane recepter protein
MIVKHLIRASCATVILNLPFIGAERLAFADDALSVAPDTSSTKQASQQSTSQGKRSDLNADQNPTSLGEIIVSAQRRDEDINKVPISMTAFSQKTMDDLHVVNLTNLAAIVPGLDILLPPPGAQGSTDIAIRGIFSGGNAPTTAIYIDETPVSIRTLSGAGDAGSFRPDIFDLERLEVLRGPQGTLFGSSAMGGAIRFVTPQPDLEQASGYSKAEIGYTDRGAPSYAVGVAYGAPIVQDMAGFRLSGWYHSDGGFIDKENPFTGQIFDRNANASHAYTLRPALTVAPLDGLTITAAAFVQRQQSDNPSEYWTGYIPNPESGKHISGALYGQPSLDEVTVPSLHIKYVLPDVVLQSDTSYLDRYYSNYDDDTQVLEAAYSSFSALGKPTVFIPGVPASWVDYGENTGGTLAWQQEFRVTSVDDGSRLHWVLGAYYRRAQETLSQLVSPDMSPLTLPLFGLTSLQFFGVPDYTATLLNGQPLQSYTWFRTVDEQKAVFGELAFDLTSRLKATAGVRIEHSAVEQQRQIVAGPTNFVPNGYSDKLLPDQVQTPITPKFALTYQVTDVDMIYATAAKGYRAGGGNAATSVGNPQCGSSLTALGLTSTPAAFSSDSVWTYELGAKDALFEGRLVTQASVFYTDWNNIQTAVSLPSCNELFTANRGRAVIQGFDLQVAAIPFDNLKLGANVAYTDAYYPSAAYGAPPASGAAAPLLNGAGDKLALVLPWTASANAEYSWNVGALWDGARAYVRADYRWLDAMSAGNPNVANYDPAEGGVAGGYRNPAYSTLNARIGAVRGGLDLSLFVNNVTNADPLINRVHDIAGSPLFYATAMRPLTVGITSLYKF